MTLPMSLNKNFLLQNQKDYENKIMYLHNKKDPRIFDLYLFDIVEQREELIFEFQLGETPTYLDKKNNLPIFTSISKPSGYDIYKIKENQREKVKFVSSKDHFEIVHVSENQKDIYALSNINRDKVALFKTDLSLETKEKNLVYENLSVWFGICSFWLWNW